MSVFILIALVITVWVTLAVVAAVVVGRMVHLRDTHEAPQRAAQDPSRRVG